MTDKFPVGYVRSTTISALRPVHQRYRRLYGPYTVDVYNGLVNVWRHGWRKGLDQRWDVERNVREAKFPLNPRRLPK